MMKLFKKKKSNPQLRTVEFIPNKPISPIFPSITKEVPIVENKPPILLMPKPRRLLTPTREILSNFDHDKTLLVEEEDNFSDDNIISPMILPTLKTHTISTSSTRYESAQEDGLSTDEEEDQLEQDHLPALSYDDPIIDNINMKQHHDTQINNKHAATNTNNEQEILLKQLKRQVEIMERQHILDREEWTKKEQELMEQGQQMMNTLLETKEQLTQVLLNNSLSRKNSTTSMRYVDASPSTTIVVDQNSATAPRRRRKSFVEGYYVPPIIYATATNRRVIPANNGNRSRPQSRASSYNKSRPQSRASSYNKSYHEDQDQDDEYEYYGNYGFDDCHYDNYRNYDDHRYQGDNYSKYDDDEHYSDHGNPHHYYNKKNINYYYYNTARGQPQY